MNREQLQSQLNELVELAGSDRAAVDYILKVKGCAPTHSAIYKARKGSGTDYTVACYISDIKAGMDMLKQELVNAVKAQRAVVTQIDHDGTAFIEYNGQQRFLEMKDLQLQDRKVINYAYKAYTK